MQKGVLKHSICNRTKKYTCKILKVKENKLFSFIRDKINRIKMLTNVIENIELLVNNVTNL